MDMYYLIYIERDNPTYYSKPDKETVTYRNLMLRKSNIRKMNEYHKKLEYHLLD